MQAHNPRAQAAVILAQVLEGKSLTALLSEIDHTEKSFIQALCFGVLRHYFSLDWLLRQLLQNPLPKKDNDITALLLIGLFQLQDGFTKEHAAVNEAVSATHVLKKTSKKNLVNAILRNFQRKQSSLIPALKNQDVRFECTDWFLKQLQHDWPEDWQRICDAQQHQPPMTLRVNLSKNSRDDYIHLLKQQDMNATPLICDSALMLDKPCNATQLPGFHEACISIQDQAGQFIPSLLNIQPGMNILDACSAPGSKLAHLFEVAPDAHYTAIEMDKQRAIRLKDTIMRHDIPVNVIIGDATRPQADWNKPLFDIILIDAPCSATGVIRRHPDIKILRRKQDILQFAQMQLQLLRQLIPLLKPNGQLLYTTCSLLKQENDDVMEQCLKESHLKHQDIHLPIGQKTPLGWQILPGDDHCDGFYFGVLSEK